MSGLIETNMNKKIETKMKKRTVAEDDCGCTVEETSMIKLKAEAGREGMREQIILAFRKNSGKDMAITETHAISVARTACPCHTYIHTNTHIREDVYIDNRLTCRMI